ncbi:hypothetical protein BJY00DRAFT_232360 [Aspergillus carlsbadensis]|nr:hypothetical protein BJY00DRAFT_232360 [Aspergillus carlsbadensis]
MSIWYMVYCLGRSLVGLLVTGVGIPLYVFCIHSPLLHYLVGLSFSGCICFISSRSGLGRVPWSKLRLHSCECVSQLVSSSSGKGFRCSSSTSSLWVVYNIGRSYAFFTLSYFSAITLALGFWARKGVFFSSSRLNLIWVLGQRDQFGEQANIKRVLGV